MPYQGTVVGSPTFGAGKFSNGVSGLSDTVYLTLPAALFETYCTGLQTWTVECWLKTTSASGTKVALAFGASGQGPWLGVVSGVFKFNTGPGSGGFASANVGSASINDGNWHHCAVVMTAGTSVQVFVDGVAAGSATGTAPTLASTVPYLGRYSSTTFAWPGEIDEVAVWGYAKYPGSTGFTPPASAYAGTEAGLVAVYHLEANGLDSARGTAFAVGTPTYNAGKFSNALAGSDSDYVRLDPRPFNLNLTATGDWTLECWLKTSNATGTKVALAFGPYGAGPWIGAAAGVFKFHTGSGSGGFAAATVGTANIADGNWHHCAVVMTGGASVQVFVDGVAAGSATGTFAAVTLSNPYLGRYFQSGFSWIGDIDELAFFNHAKYPGSTSFTPPSAAYGPTEDNVSVLHHLDSNANHGLLYDRIDARGLTSSASLMALVPNSLSAVPYNAANPTHVVIFIHAAGGDRQQPLDFRAINVVTDLLNAGYLVFCTDSTARNWGNQTGIDDNEDLYNYAAANYNLDQTFLLSASMGGLVGLTGIAQDIWPNLAAWAGVYPVTNLADMYADATFTGQINTAYGITGSSPNTYAEKTSGYDPNLRSGADFAGVPMRMYASASDTTVDKTNNADAFRTLVLAHVPEVTVVVCSGDHGDLSHWQSSDLLTFYSDALADSTAPTLSSPTGTATGETTATLGITTDEANGTLYAVVTTSSL